MNTLLNEASSQDELLKTLETIGFSEISADDFIKKFPEFKDKIRKPIEKVWGLKMRAGAYADTWVMKVDDKYDPYITYIDGNKRMHSGATFVSSFLNKISGNLKEQFVTEKLRASQPASAWIRDFIDSTNPKFKGKTKKERISMALGAYYAAQKNEAYDESSPFKANDESIEYDPEQLAAGIKVEMEHTDDEEIAKIIAKHHLAEDPEYYIKLASCVEEYGAGFEGTDELRKKYIKDTPGQRIQQFKTEMKQKTYAIVDVTNDTVVATAHTEMEAKQIVSDTMRRFDNEIDLEIVKSSERPELEEAVMTKEISQIKNEFDMELIPQSKWSKTYETNVRKVKQLYGIPQGNGQYDDVYFVIYDDENKPYGVVDIEGTSQYAKFSDAKAGLKFALNSMSEAYGESWVVYDKNTKREITPFKTRKGAMDYAAKSGGVVYSGEYYFDHQDDIKSGKLVKGKEDALQEAVSTRFIDDLLSAADKEQRKNKQLRQGQSIMIALKDMNSKLYSDVTGTEYDPFYNDKKIPALIKFLNPNWKFFELDEAINIYDYMATSEKSQFGGYTPIVVDKKGKVMYSGQASYNTQDEAKDHAEEYLKQYARGISEPRVPVKGTYVKEEKEHYDSWIIKPREGNGEQVKIKARDEISAIEIALGRKPSQNEIDFFNFHYILIHEKTNVSTLRHMKIVELATKCTDLELVKEFVEQQYKPQTSALQIKESFLSFVSNK